MRKWKKLPIRFNRLVKRRSTYIHLPTTQHDTRHNPLPSCFQSPSTSYTDACFQSGLKQLRDRLDNEDFQTKCDINDSWGTLCDALLKTLKEEVNSKAGMSLKSSDRFKSVVAAAEKSNAQLPTSLSPFPNRAASCKANRCM